MGLLSLGLVLTVVGVAGLAVAAVASDSLFFTIESSVALVAGMTCLAIGGLRHLYPQRPHGAAPGDMDIAPAIDAAPAVAVAAADASSR